MKPIISALFLLFFITNSSYAQFVDAKFGQNRVQYENFAWKLMKSPSFITYFYNEGNSLAEYTMRTAEEEIFKIETFLEYQTNFRMEILVFNDLSDMNQSNIGYSEDDANDGRLTQVNSNKIFVYFNGDHTHLKKQIRTGIARVLVNTMLYGSDVQEAVQNNILLNLPDWFVEGLVEYIGEKWNPDLDNKLKDGVLSGKYKLFSRFTAEDPVFAGHSFWYFVSQQYSEKAISNMLFITRVNRSFENGFIFVLGLSYKKASEQWYKYFFKRYLDEDKNPELPTEGKPIVKRELKGARYSNLRLSPLNSHIAYVTHELGEFKVHVVDLLTDDDIVVFKGGYKTKMLVEDENYPHVDWDPKGKKLAVIYEKKEVVRVFTYDLENEKKTNKEVGKFERITSAKYTDRSGEMIISAIKGGQSDIFTLSVGSRKTKQLTNDYYDDRDPAVVVLNGERSVIFSSNRIGTSLKKAEYDSIPPFQTFDLYMLKLGSKKAKDVERLTSTPLANETSPSQLTNQHYTYLSDENGIVNRFVGKVDTAFAGYYYVIHFSDSNVYYNRSEFIKAQKFYNGQYDSFGVYRELKDSIYNYPITNYIRNIVEHSVAPAHGKFLDLILINNYYEFFIKDIPQDLHPSNKKELENTLYKNDIIGYYGFEEFEENSLEEERKDIFSNIFPGVDSLQIDLDSRDDIKAYKLNSKKIKTTPYLLKFSMDKFVAKVDNSVLFNRYENFSGNGPIYSNPGINGRFTVSISDMMEDYRITGGMRIPTSFTGGEYLLSFERLKKRWDKKVLYYREATIKSQDFIGSNGITQGEAFHVINYFEGGMKYPFDLVQALNLKLGYRNYRISVKAIDSLTLGEVPSLENWISAMSEYVFDNTYPVQINIRYGTRIKVFAEWHKKFQADVIDGLNVSFNEGFLQVYGFDVRNYQRIHRQIILATRLTAGASLGSSRLLYYLGGMENWLLPKFDESTEVNPLGNYGFQTLAVQMRGFDQNIRNGSNYLVGNIELRVPIFSYLMNRPLRSGFVKNFQVTGFFDFGSAWEGLSPFSQDNPFNTEVIDNGFTEITVNHYQDPFVVGYGFGARTSVLGYFIKTDVSWGLDSGFKSGRTVYFTLGKDF